MNTVRTFVPENGTFSAVFDGSLVNAIRPLGDTSFTFETGNPSSSRQISVRYSVKNKGYDASVMVGNGWFSIAVNVQLPKLIEALAEYMSSMGFDANLEELKKFVKNVPIDDHRFASPMNSREKFFAEVKKNVKAGKSVPTNDGSVYEDREFFESHSFDTVVCPYCGEEQGPTAYAFTEKYPGFKTVECSDCFAGFHLEVRQDSEGNFYVWNATI